MTFIAIGLALLARLELGSSLVDVYMSMIPLATGMAISMTPLTSLIMSSVPLGRAGIGSAMNDTTRELGGALGVAILGSIVTSRYATGISDDLANLPAEAAKVADTGLTGALQVGAQIGGEQGAQLIAAAQQSFVDGLGTAAIVGSLVVITAAIAARFLLPREGDVFPPALPNSRPQPPRDERCRDGFRQRRITGRDRRRHRRLTAVQRTLRVESLGLRGSRRADFERVSSDRLGKEF